VIIVILPEGHQERYYLRDCTPYKIYECTEYNSSVGRYVFTDDRNDEVGLSERDDGVSYLIL